jgi:hypothetical protein
MRADINTVRFIKCPKCGADRLGSIDRLKPGTSFGPWSCQDLKCRFAIVGTVTEDGADIEPAKTNEDPHRAPRLTLLQFRDLYFVHLNRYGGDPEVNDFFYHSHQCPTNLLRDIVDVFNVDGSDPHGVMRYVADIPWSQETEDSLDGQTLETLFALFKTDGQPAPTEWPEDDRGMLPWIAELQRRAAQRKAAKA